MHLLSAWLRSWWGLSRSSITATNETVEFAAQEDAWFCAHGRPSACREFDEDAYEERWEQRELAYRVSFFALGASALGLTAIGLRRRRE